MFFLTIKAGPEPIPNTSMSIDRTARICGILIKRDIANGDNADGVSVVVGGNVVSIVGRRTKCVVSVHPKEGGGFQFNLGGYFAHNLDEVEQEGGKIKAPLAGGFVQIVGYREARRLVTKFFIYRGQ